MARAKLSKEQIEALDKREAHWKGTYRYVSPEGTIFPEMAGSPYWTDPAHNLMRQICTGVDRDTGELRWAIVPDAPEAPRGFDVNAGGSLPNDETHLIAATPPFDHQPASYNSDQHSGGPANFDGVGGGKDNPRIPALEGEKPNEYNDKLADFQAQIASVNS